MKQTLPVIGSVLLMAATALPLMAQQDKDSQSSKSDQSSQSGQSSQSRQGGKTLKASDMTTATATVQDIDKEKRTVTLKGENGKTFTVKVGEDVQKFDQLKKGDQVKATYYESVALSLRKPGEPPAATGEKEAVATPESGGKAVIRTTQAAATIENIDSQKREVTLKGPEGKSKTVKVPQDVQNFDRLQKGDQVVVRYTEAFAVKVEPE